MLLSFTLAIFLLSACSQTITEKSSSKTTSSENTPLRVAIAPYQEMALLVNEKQLGLEKKYGTRLEILTLPWEEIPSAVASSGQTVDVGFASLPDYLAKVQNLNRQGDDPLLFIYPAWMFHGGGFVTFNPAVPEMNTQAIKNPNLIKKFLSFRLGIQKNSWGHMILWTLANSVGLKLSELPIIDTTLNDGFLAAENGSLDASQAGLTQRTEALKQHGRVVLTMDTLGLVDPGGFICKESVYKKRKKDIDALIRMWFDCANYVLSDLDHHSDTTIAYLKTNSSTKYTLAEFKRALSQEYIPKSVAEAEREIISGKGRYSLSRAAAADVAYLMDIGATKSPPQIPKMINLNEQNVASP